MYAFENQGNRTSSVDMSGYLDILSDMNPTKEPSLTSLEDLGQAAECLRTLSHPVRLRMVQMLLRDRYTVGELADACGIKSHMASEHLRLMQHCGMLSSERDGRKTYYAVSEPQLGSIMHSVEERFDSLQ